MALPSVVFASYVARNPTEPASLTNYFRDSRPTIDDTSGMMAQAPKVDALDIFLNSLGSRETKSKYKNKIDTFLTFCRAAR